MSRLAKYLHPRDEIMQTMERIYRYRMTTTSGGNLSIRRSDYLALVPTRLEPPPGLEGARLYHQDRELGLRCLAAGMRGIFDRQLHAVHEHRRDPAGFLRDAFGRGVCGLARPRRSAGHAAG